MLSQSGRIYEHTIRVSPMSKEKRQKMYSRPLIKARILCSSPKFSPFNTCSRESRHSYLLRVTKEPNPHTNYQTKYDVVMQKNKRATIDRAKFTRFIGDVKDQDFSSQPNKRAKCTRSLMLSPESRMLLTIRDHQKWRRTNQHLDFKRQPKTNRQKSLSINSTQYTTKQLLKLSETTQCSFSHSTRPQAGKAHDFNSYKGHQYLLKELAKRAPQYNVSDANQSFVRKSMRQTHDEVRFNLFKNKTITRVDRADPDWNARLDYEPKQNKQWKGCDFTQQTNRKQNKNHSEYPIRLSLQRITQVL